MRKMLALVVIAMMAAPALAQTSMECERYQIGKEGTKAERSTHRFTILTRKSSLKYQHVSGRLWYFPTEVTMPITWQSNDGHRIVATWIAPASGNGHFLGPVHVTDIDFSTQRLNVKTFGGLIDLDPVVQDPWNYDCRLLSIGDSK